MKQNIREIEQAFQWEDDPLIFIFNNEIPGKVRMHTRRLDWKDWVKIDKTYPMQMKLRESLLQSNKNDVFVTNEDKSTSFAKQELLEKLIKYLPERFPDKFQVRDNGIYNKVLDEFVSSNADDDEDPLIRAGKLTQEDWVVLEWDEALQSYCLTAGVVYFPMRWSLREKWNQSMPLIHKPVNAFNKHLLNNVQSLFKRMTPSAPVWRGNWAIFNDLRDQLDLYTPTGHTERNDVNTVSTYKGEATGKELMFRAEYQTLIKLPESGAIVFSIRTYQRFLDDFKNLPVDDAKGLCKAIETLDPDIHEYKGAQFWEDASLLYLKSVIKEKDHPPMLPSTLKSPFAIASAAAILGAAILIGVTQLR